MKNEIQIQNNYILKKNKNKFIKKQFIKYYDFLKKVIFKIFIPKY